MEQYSFIVRQGDINQRLDKFLTDNFRDLSRSFIQKLIAEKQVLVNGECFKANYKLKENDKIKIIIPTPELIEIKPENIPLEIVYEDRDLLVVNKPVGMVVHPAKGNYSKTLVNALLYHCSPNLSKFKESLRPGIVHRIDKDTSGLLVIAKNNYVHDKLVEQLKEHTVNRAYLALVQGVVNEPGGIIDAPIGRDVIDRKKMSVNIKNSKRALTKYYVMERFKNYTFVNCHLETGRTHQIRVHMAYINHPLVGDYLYGSRENSLGFKGQALHAYKLGFIHPRTKEKLEFTTPLPEFYQAVLKKLREE